jgi:hypothetical protein
MPSSTTRKQPADRQPARKTTKRASSARASAQPDPIPTVEDPTSKYAPDAWLSGGVGGMEDLTVPSGQLCLVRRPGMEGLMKSGVLHNVDSLSQIVNEKHLKRVQGKAGEPETSEIDMHSLMSDTEGLAEVTHVIDKVVCHCVVKPEVHMTPNDITRRQSGVVYADMIDLVDKMFIFNFVVGGTRDLESFRSGLGEAVGGLAPVEGVQVQAE